ncbi:hypothetical protein B5X24_HaOG204796 [Helicoverpa armigera]|uniref:Uncharacterized protein n=1 Tax=Helicoverpa armigera TaxID=29058 RepID=A0A2W1BRL1_HELAM|nr:hypothetical protein B5X24_HaOG204796 [Helicoverpa armigera]
MNMDDVFRDLEKHGKTDVDHLVQWMKDSKLIDATKEQEMKARKLFMDAHDAHRVELNKFKEVIEKLAAEQKKTVEQLSKQLAAEGPRFVNAAMAGLAAFTEALKGMAEVFRNLEKEGKTNIDNLVKWMQDSKLIESTKEEQDRARAMFSAVADATRITMDEFKHVISQLAAGNAETVEDFSRQLADEGPCLMRAATQEMAEVFRDLEREGKTNIENLVKWMRDSKLIESTKEEQDRAKALFSAVADATRITVDEFKHVISQLAADNRDTVEHYSKQLADEGLRVKRATDEGIAAFKDALARK